MDQRKVKLNSKLKKKAELASLFKVTQAKVPIGTDPKSVLCEFFKQGLCTKGDKCKFSHDLNVARKGEKIDMFTDRRFTTEDNEDVTMENWTQEKLQQVVYEKHASEGALKGRQAITCKYFIEAVESKKYGWFWECPNGGNKCPYKHALPPDYVLKSEKKKLADEEEDEKIPLEEIIEDERRKLTTRTPLTKEIFLAWKAKREKTKNEEKEKANEKRRADIRSGKAQMSGIEIFKQNPELFVDDDEAAGAEDFQTEYKVYNNKF